MKRLIAMSLFTAIILTGCSAGQETSETTSAPDTTDASTETQVLTEKEQYPLPEKDMEGFELRFYNFDESYLTWAINTLDADEENGDNLNDAIYRRNRRIEDQYHCTISETLVSNPNDGLRDLIYSGDNLYDIIMLYDENVASAYSEGLLATWDSLDYVDLDRSWWDQSANEVFSIKGKQFAAVGNFSLSMITRGFVMLFNKDIIENAGLDDNLYELVRSGNWTLGKFAEIAQKMAVDLNGDGQFDGADQYAVSGAVKLHFGSLITGAGVKYIDEDADGLPYFAIAGNDHAMDVFEKIFNLHNGTNIFYKITDNINSGSTESREMFKSGQLAFQGTATKSIALYRDVNFDIGIIPYPKYDAAQESYYTLTSGGAVATLPVTLPEDRRDNVGILLDALSRDSQDNLIPTYQEVVLKTKYTRDEDSAEMLDIIFHSSVYDLGLSVWPSSTYYVYMSSYLTMNDNFASLTASMEKSVENVINTMIEKIDAGQ